MLAGFWRSCRVWVVVVDDIYDDVDDVGDDDDEHDNDDDWE